MPSLKSSSSKRLVLDIGSSAIRLCELAQTKSGYQLTKYIQRELPLDPSMDEEQRRAVRRDTLKQLLRDAKVRSKKVVFGVPGQSVFTRARALPPVPEYKVPQIVRYEIQQQIPFSLDQIALDYQVLGRTEAGGYDVLMAAIKVDVVDRHLDLLQDVKRTVNTVDVAPLAAYNWLKHTGEFGDQGDCVALIDIGAGTTDIVVERENQFRFTRSLNIGGNDITSAIARNFNISFAEAEKLKRERGFAPTGDAQRDGKGGEVIGQVLNRLVGEISRSFSYFRSQPGGGPVSRVILTGGTASLRNIVPYLQRQLGLDVRIAQPLAGVAVSAAAQEANEHPEQAAVVLGLALRTLRPVPIEVNLIPPRITEAARRKEQAFYWILSFVCLALIMASFIPMRAKRNELVLKEIDQLKRNIATFDASLYQDPMRKSQFETDLQQVNSTLETLQSRVEQLDKARNGRTFWLDKLVAINDARPQGKGVWFSSIQTTYIGDTGGGGGMMGMGGMMGGLGGLGGGPGAGPGGPGGPMGGPMGGMGLGGGMMGGLGAGMGSSGRQYLPSSGFPGLTPMGSSGMGGLGGMGLGGGPMGGMGLGGGPMGGMGLGGGMGGDSEGPSTPPQRPNGFIILGYAQDPETLAAFVDNLKRSPAFIGEKGVYLDQAATNRVPFQTLASAAIDTSARAGMGAMGGGRSGSGGRRFDDEGAGMGLGGGMMGGMGMGGLGMPAPPTGGFGGGAYYDVTSGPNVTAFRVDVQFEGDPVELQEAPSMRDRRSGAAGGGGLGGFGGFGGSGGRRDEE